MVHNYSLTNHNSFGRKSKSPTNSVILNYSSSLFKRQKYKKIQRRSIEMERFPRTSILGFERPYNENCSSFEEENMFNSTRFEKSRILHCNSQESIKCNCMLKDCPVVLKNIKVISGILCDPRTCYVLLDDVMKNNLNFINFEKEACAHFPHIEETDFLREGRLQKVFDLKTKDHFCKLKEQLRIMPCSVILKDCRGFISHKRRPKIRTILPLSSQATREIIENDYLSSDHINKFHDILAEGTTFQPCDVLLIWLKDHIYPVTSRHHIQILAAAPTKEVTHWVCTYFDGKVIRVYDSQCRRPLTIHQIHFLNKLFPERPKIVYESVQKQTNDYDCGVFAIAFATTLAEGFDPAKEVFDVPAMRPHLLKIFSTNCLKPFPRLSQLGSRFNQLKISVKNSNRSRLLNN